MICVTNLKRRAGNDNYDFGFNDTVVAPFWNPVRDIL